MITGRLPFEGEYEGAVVYAILHEEPEPLARYKTGRLGLKDWCFEILSMVKSSTVIPFFAPIFHFSF